MKWITREHPKIDRIDHEMLTHGMIIYNALYAWCSGTPLKAKAARFLGVK